MKSFVGLREAQKIARNRSAEETVAVALRIACKFVEIGAKLLLKT